MFQCLKNISGRKSGGDGPKDDTCDLFRFFRPCPLISRDNVWLMFFRVHFRYRSMSLGWKPLEVSLVLACTSLRKHMRSCIFI